MLRAAFPQGETILSIEASGHREALLAHLVADGNSQQVEAVASGALWNAGGLFQPDLATDLGETIWSVPVIEMFCLQSYFVCVMITALLRVSKI